MIKALPVIAALVLTGCNQSPAPVEAPGPDTSETTTVTPPPVRYSCADGTRVEASYPTSETAHIVHEGKSVDMTIAVSASGARYVGGGWEWWTKGLTEGTLSPLKPGEETAQTAGTICTAARFGMS